MLPPRDVDIQAELMRIVHETLNTIGLPHFLVDGALIHIVRDGKLMPYNQDIDFACYAEEIRPMMAIIKRRFLSSGFDVRAYKKNTRISLYKHGELVSIQGYVLKGKFRYLKNKRIPARYFANKESVCFRGIEYDAPMVNKYLSWKYSDWKKPYDGNTKNKKYLNKRKLVGHV